MVNMLLLSRHSWRNFGELALTIILVKKIIIAIFDFYFYNSRRLGRGGGDERRSKSKERAGTER